MLTGPSVAHFSSAELPERERATMLREVFGRGVCNMEIFPLTDMPHIQATLRTLTGLNLIWGRNSPLRLDVNRDPNRDGDMFMMSMFANPLQVRHKAEELELSNGSAVMISTEQIVSTVSHSECRHITLGLHRRTLAPLIPNVDDAVMRPIPANCEALRLLKSYLNILQDHATSWTVEIEHAVVTHIHDLVALAVGASRDVIEQAGNRGLRAARLDATKRLIFEYLCRPDLTVNKVAAAQNVSPRYVQMLFEAEGTTFSIHVLRERLANAHRALSDPRLANRPIGVIAFDSGFGDLSYFNRVFRRTYGETPSDVRNAACRQRHDHEGFEGGK